MTYLLHSTIAALLLLAVTAQTTMASTPSDPAKGSAVMMSFHPESQIVIRGSSNVRDWTMEVTEIDGSFSVRQTTDSNGADVFRFDQVRVRIPVEGILSGQGSMDSKAHKTLKMNSYPTIHFDANSTESLASENGAMTVRTEGRLIVAGRPHNIALELEGTRRDDGTIRFQGSTDLTFGQLGLDRPTALLGTLRVADEISIDFDIILSEES